MSRCNEGPFSFTIGQGPWDKEIRYYTAELDSDYWAGFHPMTAADIAAIERETQRRLADDFKEFLRVFGCGIFPDKFGGHIADAEDIIACCHAHLWMILGSANWATPEDQRRFYVTRGQFNPTPDDYTPEALMLDDVCLLDFLQIGSNGSCCYHQVYVGEEPGPLGYCLLTPEGVMEDRSPSFSEGLRKILTGHWFWDDYDPPEGTE